MTHRVPLLAAALALALAGCSAEPDETDDAPVAAPQARPVLAAEDIDGAALTGELACSFNQRGTAGPLLLARADVIDEAYAEGVLRLGPSALRLRAAEPGGFNAMVEGTRFTAGELEARVVVTSDTPTSGGESPSLPARLEIASPAGNQAIDGEWTCGP